MFKPKNMSGFVGQESYVGILRSGEHSTGSPSICHVDVKDCQHYCKL